MPQPFLPIAADLSCLWGAAPPWHSMDGNTASQPSPAPIPGNQSPDADSGTSAGIPSRDVASVGAREEG